MTRRTLHSILVALALAALACEAAPPTPAAPAPADQTPPGQPIRGTVQERIDGSGYSYLRLKTATGETWAAVPQTDAATGASVTVVDAMPMNGFESKTLARKFERLVFGRLESQDQAMGALPKGHPPVGANAPKAEPVAKAEGADARTVAETFADRASLAGKSIVVSGRVVKFTAGVLDRNWLHIQDGSGNATNGDHDLTVTTGETVQVGEVVTVRGVVAVDRDFGAGYAYPVLVEQASVAR
jgi:hypothetical protein